MRAAALEISMATAATSNEIPNALYIHLSTIVMLTPTNHQWNDDRWHEPGSSWLNIRRINGVSGRSRIVLSQRCLEQFVIYKSNLFDARTLRVGQEVHHGRSPLVRGE
jgi:hypothetical protein